jgi:hypothetical protein
MRVCGKGFKSYVGHGYDFCKQFFERKGKQIKVVTDIN